VREQLTIEPDDVVAAMSVDEDDGARCDQESNNNRKHATWCGSYLMVWSTASGSRTTKALFSWDGVSGPKECYGAFDGVQAWDALTLVCVSVLLGLASLAASFLPARRAASVNPVEALRTE
jgi:hypothetical protein